MSKHRFTKDMFKICYSINCFTKGRPSEYHRDHCRKNIEKIMNSFNPELIIISGNFALHTLTDKWGITKYDSKLEKIVLFKKERKVMY